MIVAIGLVHIVGGTVVQVPPDRRRPVPAADPLEPIGILLLLKAFAGGSVALTGIEAIANGVPAFKPPEAKNAANTLTAMAILLGVLFIGLTCSWSQYGIVPTERRRRRRSSRSRRGPSSATARSSSYLPAFTALILFLAANTSFNAFPRLAAILAEDGYMPRQFAFRGDRLAYSWGIVLLAGDRHRAARRLRRRHPRADPALLGRRVRLLHAQPDRHGPALADASARPAGAGGWRSTASARS